MRATVSWDCPVGCASGDALHQQTRPGLRSSVRLGAAPRPVKPAAAHASAMELVPPTALWRQSSVRRRHRGCRVIAASRGGEPLCVSLPASPCPPIAAPDASHRPPRSPPAKPSQNRERKLRRSERAEGTPLPDSKVELPPVIRRAEVVAFALVALLIICIIVGALCRQGVLPADHDGVHRRHHAVAGGELPRALPDSARGRRRADRGRGRRRRRLHGRPDRLAGDGMEQQASGTRRAC